MRVLRDYHMPPFKMCIDNVKPVAVMPSYNEVDGIPSHANKWLLKDVLRKEWGFKGMIVSDYYGVGQLFNKHFICSDANDAVETAFNACVQYEFPQGNLYKQLPKLLNKGKVKLKDVDRAVKQVLTFKFEPGMFEIMVGHLSANADLKKTHLLMK
jgi:beta-glucosidase